MVVGLKHNLMALNTARNLSEAYGMMAQSTRRLSSGLRVGIAADDAAGLSVREIMRGEIITLNQGIRNANDAISVLQTADGALSVIDEKLIRMKELAMQASTGTYSSDQRMIIDSEYQAMASEITRIASATDFNGVHLLNGNLSGENSSHNGNGMNPTGPMKIHFGSGNDSAEDYYYIQIGTATASALGFHAGGPVTPQSIAQAEHLRITQDWLPAGSGSPGVIQAAMGSDPAFQIYEKEGAPLNSDRYYLVRDTASGGYRLFHTNPTATSLVGEVDVTDDTSSGISSISTQSLAQRALATIDRAIVSKDGIRAHLGSIQVRLQNTISNLGIQSMNLQAAESQISDVDVSTEMTTYTRLQIITQSAVAMLSQANALPKMALQLIAA